MVDSVPVVVLGAKEVAWYHVTIHVTPHAAEMDVRGVVDLHVVVVEDRVAHHVWVYVEMVAVLDVMIVVQETVSTHVVLAATHAAEDVDKVVEAVVHIIARVIARVIVLEVVVRDVQMYQNALNRQLMEPSRDLLMAPAIHIKELR